MIDLFRPLLMYLPPMIVSYLLGSIPTGYWLGKLWKGIDVRQQGSGNLGATNVFRVLGWKAGLFTLIVDVLKGWLAVQLSTPTLMQFVPNPNLPRIVTLHLVAGISAILGHSFSCFVGFRGGKGVATSAGVFLALLPVPAAISLVIFAVCLAITRMVSASSIAAAIALSIAAFIYSPNPQLAGAAAAVAILVIWRHRSNIQRIIEGTEARIGTKGAA